MRQDVLSWCAGDPDPSTRRATIPITDEQAARSRQDGLEVIQRLEGYFMLEPDHLEDEKRWNGHGGVGHGYSMKKGKRRVVANSKYPVCRRRSRLPKLTTARCV